MFFIAIWALAIGVLRIVAAIRLRRKISGGLDGAQRHCVRSFRFSAPVAACGRRPRNRLGDRLVRSLNGWNACHAEFGTARLTQARLSGTTNGASDAMGGMTS